MAKDQNAAQEKPSEASAASAFTRFEALMDRARKRAAMAESFRVQGRDVMAKAQIKRCTDLLFAALECDAGSMNARFMLVSCLLQLRDFARAKEQAVQAIYNLAVEDGGALEEPVMHLAAAYASLGQDHVGDAISSLRYAAKVFPEDPQSCAILSAVLERQGCLQQAKRAAALALMRDDQPVMAGLLPSQRRHVEGLLLVAVDREGGAAAETEDVDELDLDELDFEGAPVKVPWGSAEVVSFPVSPPKACTEIGGIGAQVAPSPVRSRRFGPAAQDSCPGGENAIREAAMKDLEALFSNLMPSPGTLSSAQAPVAEVAQVGAGPCCFCRKRIPDG